MNLVEPVILFLSHCLRKVNLLIAEQLLPTTPLTIRLHGQGGQWRQKADPCGHVIVQHGGDLELVAMPALHASPPWSLITLCLELLIYNKVS